jgi:hypothetical protein
VNLINPRHRPVFSLTNLRVRVENLQKKKTYHGQGDPISIHRNTKIVRANICTIPSNTSKTIFCKRSYDLHLHLEKLHRELITNPCEVVQTEIDSYIYCVHFLDNQIPEDRPLSTKAVHNIISLFKTFRTTTSNVWTIPDILHSFSSRIIYGQWENPLYEQVCRHVFPCLNKTKWINRQKKDICNYEPGQPGIFLKIMLAMLMGYYPTCAKKPLFVYRVFFTVAVRELLLKSDEEQYAFILKHINLVRLSVAEYATFTLKMLPAEFQIMARHFDIESYLNLCHACCEIFRICLMQGSKISWDRLEQTAFKSVDKIVRSARIGQKMNIPYVASQAVIKKFVNVDCKKNPTSIESLLQVAKKCPVAYAHQESLFLYSQIIEKILPDPFEKFPKVPEIQRLLPSVIQNIHGILSVYELPANFIHKQLVVLQEKYTTQAIKLLNITSKYICLHCLLRMTAKQYSVEEAINGMIRMDFRKSDEISCNKCMTSKHVVKIDLLGRVLRINQDLIYICPHCADIHSWDGDGLDLLHCRKQNPKTLRLLEDMDDYDPTLGYVKGIREVHETMLRTLKFNAKKKHISKKRESCFLCASGTNNKSVMLLHVNSARYLRIYLCGKHTPPNYILQYLRTTDEFDLWSYEEFFRHPPVTTGLQRRKRKMSKRRRNIL